MTADKGTKGQSYISFYGPRVPEEYVNVPTSQLPTRAPGLGLIQDTSAHGIANIFNARGLYVIFTFKWG